MTVLTLTLKKEPAYPVDVSALVPEKLFHKKKREIAETILKHGRHDIKVSELFDISGGKAETLVFKGCSRRLTCIGSNMLNGRILVEGESGDYLGQGMQGGYIEVKGTTGDWTATGMRGGKIEIYGNTGTHTGAAGQGEQAGMSGGTVIVHGNAGERTAERMRRGTIVVFGQCGDYTACNMLAGTVIILGKTGSYVGLGMRRGSVILSRKPRHMLPTFRHCGVLKIEFLRLLFKQLARSCETFEVFRDFGPEAIRYAGDTGNKGLGEILLLKNARTSK